MNKLFYTATDANLRVIPLRHVKRAGKWAKSQGLLTQPAEAYLLNANLLFCIYKDSIQNFPGKRFHFYGDRFVFL